MVVSLRFVTSTEADKFMYVTAKSDESRESIRDAALSPQTAFLVLESAAKQLASSQRMGLHGVTLAQKSTQLAKKGFELGQKVDQAIEKGKIQGQLAEGADAYEAGAKPDGGGSSAEGLLDADVGDGVSVVDVLGINEDGTPIEDATQRRAVARERLDYLLEGDFKSEDDLREAGFPEGQRKLLMHLKDRGPGNDVTNEEIAEFLYEEGPLPDEAKARGQMHKAVDDFLEQGAFAPAKATAQVGVQTAEMLARRYQEERGKAEAREGAGRQLTGVILRQARNISELAINEQPKKYSA